MHPTAKFYRWNEHDESIKKIFIRHGGRRYSDMLCNMKKTRIVCNRGPLVMSRGCYSKPIGTNRIRRTMLQKWPEIGYLNRKVLVRGSPNTVGGLVRLVVTLCC
ncbi:hypothetical protein OROHE_018277 [Orobanche hederae]